MPTESEGYCLRQFKHPTLLKGKNRVVTGSAGVKKAKIERLEP
ncbi:hypothetical protein [Sediminibacillus albus]|nr:hypothetical protein [Sediminibacillus albus]